MRSRSLSIRRRIKNIILFLVLLVITLGAYYNIQNSKADTTIKMSATALDNYGYLGQEEFELDAKVVEDDLYEIELPQSVNNKKVFESLKVTLEMPVKPEATEDQKTDETDKNAENAENEKAEQSEVKEESSAENTAEDKADSENAEASKESAETSEESKSEEKADSEIKTETIELQVIDNKIQLTGYQVANGKLAFEVKYDVAILEKVKEVEGNFYNPNKLSEKTEEERKELEKLEEAKTVYYQTLKYEDIENSRVVEVKGFLPLGVKIQVKEVTEERLKEIFGDANIQTAYDIEILKQEEQEVLIDEANPELGTKKVIVEKEINPADYGQAVEVIIQDKNIKTGSNVYHVNGEDNSYEALGVNENEKKSISFHTTAFSEYAVSDDYGIMLTASTTTSATIMTPASSSTPAKSVTVTVQTASTSNAVTGYAWTTSTSTPSSYTTASSNYLTLTKNGVTGTYYLHIKDKLGYTKYTGPYVLDNTSPTVSITGPGTSIAASSGTYTITFSEVVSGFAQSDITVSGLSGNITSLTTSDNKVFTLKLSFTASCTVSVKVAAGVCSDEAGNTNSVSNTYSTTVDLNRPSCTITSSAGISTTASSITYTFTWSETVSGFATADITVTNGTKGTFATVTSGKVYTLVVTNSGACTQKVTVKAGTVTDSTGNTNPESSLTVTIKESSSATVTDATRPTILFGEEEMQEGLIRHYEAINNMGYGHASSGTVWKDLSGNYDATITGATIGTDLITFDGSDDWANCGQVSGITNAFTMQISLSLGSVQSGQKYLWGNWESGGFGLELKDGKPYAEVYISGVGYKTVTHSTALTAGLSTLYHLALTYDGSTLRLYKDGAQVATTAASGTVGSPASSTVLALGTNPKASAAQSGYANVKISSAMLFNRCLSAAEIQRNINTPQVPIRTTTSSSIKLTVRDIQTGIKYWGLTTSTTAPTSTGTTSSSTLNTWNLLTVTTSETTVTFSGLTTGTYYAWAKDATGNTTYIQIQVKAETAAPNVRVQNSTEVVSDGLIRYYDAVNNTQSGHSSSATTWHDLSGNYNRKIKWSNHKRWKFNFYRRFICISRICRL